LNNSLIIHTKDWSNINENTSLVSFVFTMSEEINRAHNVMLC
jgi:hypothetical protein